VQSGGRFRGAKAAIVAQMPGFSRPPVEFFHFFRHKQANKKRSRQAGTAMRHHWPAGLLLLALLATPVLAETPGGGDQPGIKRIKPPAAGATRRILVQIDPEEQARVLAAGIEAARRQKEQGLIPDTEVAAAKPSSQTSTVLDWYWQAVSPALGDSDGRFFQAVAMLSQGPGGQSVPAPRLQSLQDIARAHGSDILGATIGTRVSPALVLAVIGIESAGQTAAVSSAGAQGLMQLIPDTAARFGVTDATDPTQNIKGGVAYLDWLMGEFDGDPLMVLAGYNAGEGAVRNNGGVPPFDETRAYVPKVLAAWSVARGLCLTPPELVSDGCVFNVNAVNAPAG